MPGATQMRGFERCVWFVVLFVTGDVRPPTPTELAAAKDIVAMVDAGDLSGLPPRLSPAARRELSMAQLSSQTAQLHDTYGSARGVRELIAGHNHATFAVVAERGEWQLYVALTEDGEIDELRPEPAVARSPPLGLPVTGEWRVSHGGPTRNVNQHVGIRDQRRAADLMAVNAANERFAGDGSRNEDYFGYGRDIVAMADGVVAVVVDGVPDNVPHEVQDQFGPGNMVLLEHGDGLYTFYAHLISGSIAVEVGEQVERGQVLGHCGNSGRSHGPHLHVQGQDHLDMREAWGVELVFENVWKRRGKGEPRLVAEYEFYARDIVRMAAE